MPGKDPNGCIVTSVIGILGLGKIESFDLGGIFIATMGAIVLLIIYRLVMKKKS